MPGENAQPGFGLRTGREHDITTDGASSRGDAMLKGQVAAHPLTLLERNVKLAVLYTPWASRQW